MLILTITECQALCFICITFFLSLLFVNFLTTLCRFYCNKSCVHYLTTKGSICQLFKFFCRLRQSVH